MMQFAILSHEMVARCWKLELNRPSGMEKDGGKLVYDKAHVRMLRWISVVII